MTATDRLRALLDECGVEWTGTLYTNSTQGHPTNTSLGEEYHDAAFIEYFDGNVLRLFDITPEQAIAAILGSGTCKYDFVPNIGNGFLNACGLKCSCCGREQMSMDAPKFCPNCGMRVEDEQ